MTGGHPHTMSWFGMVARFSDLMKAKWPKAAGGDDDLDLFGDDSDDGAAAKAAAAAAAK